MIKTLPHENLLRYVYNELPDDQQQAVEQSLQHDPDLAATCVDILVAQRLLDGAQRTPSNKATNSILQYSRTFLNAG